MSEDILDKTEFVLEEDSFERFMKCLQDHPFSENKAAQELLKQKPKWSKDD
jgi:uncharacterized protein (DUF1778 family)